MWTHALLSWLFAAAAATAAPCAISLVDRGVRYANHAVLPTDTLPYVQVPGPCSARPTLELHGIALNLTRCDGGWVSDLSGWLEEGEYTITATVPTVVQAQSHICLFAARRRAVHKLIAADPPSIGS